MSAMTNDKRRPAIDEQIEYYRARAGEYDEWFLRTGRYDRGEEHRREWFAEAARVEEALQAEGALGSVLELACGTGLWTQHLVKQASHVMAVDASPEVIEINRGRMESGQVSYVEADLFNWMPSALYDFVFFGFWLSHVPEERFDEFWRSVGAALKPGGRVFFVDGLLTQDSTATNHKAIDRSGEVERKLNDGRVFRIVKVFHEPEVLMERLRKLGWQGWARGSGRFFLYGCVAPR